MIPANCAVVDNQSLGHHHDPFLIHCTSVLSTPVIHSRQRFNLFQRPSWPKIKYFIPCRLIFLFLLDLFYDHGRSAVFECSSLLRSNITMSPISTTRDTSIYLFLLLVYCRLAPPTLSIFMIDHSSTSSSMRHVFDLFLPSTIHPGSHGNTMPSFIGYILFVS